MDKTVKLDISKQLIDKMGQWNSNTGK